MPKSVLIACTSDHHCGSTLGLVPDEGVRLDDGGTYQPSKAQLWTWYCWTDYWQRIDKLRRQEKADLWVLYNGDMFEGDHHATTQIVSRNPEAQDYIAGRVFGVPKALHPAKTFVVRGTEVHVGTAGSAEEGRARSLNAVRDPETSNWSFWRLRLEVHGVLIDAQHHGRVGTRPWTRASAVGTLAYQIWSEHAERKLRWPDLAIRSHRHQYGDSGNTAKTRLIQTPAWQLKTAYAHKVVPESIADIGGVAVILRADSTSEVRPILYEPSLPEVVRA